MRLSKLAKVRIEITEEDLLVRQLIILCIDSI